jgi:hypothetical protein
MTTTVFDESERRIWAGRADPYAASFAKLCAYAVPGLLDAAGAALPAGHGGPYRRAVHAG